MYLVGKELQGLAAARFEMSRATCRATVLGEQANEAALDTAAACEKPQTAPDYGSLENFEGAPDIAHRLRRRN